MSTAISYLILGAVIALAVVDVYLAAILGWTMKKSSPRLPSHD